MNNNLFVSQINEIKGMVSKINEDISIITQTTKETVAFKKAEVAKLNKAIANLVSIANTVGADLSEVPEYQAVEDRLENLF